MADEQRRRFNLMGGIGGALAGVAQSLQPDVPYYSNYLSAQQKRREMEMEAQRYAQEQAIEAQNTTFDQQYKNKQLMLDKAKLRVDAQRAKVGGGIPRFTMDASGNLVQLPGILVETPAQKKERSITTASEKDVAVRNAKLEELTKAIDFFEQKINEIPSGTGLAGRAKGFKTEAQAILQTNPKAAAYKADVEGMRSQIARGLGEVGNLSETEQKAAINLLPKLTDNTETRVQKLKNFRDYVAVKTGQKAQETAPTKTADTIAEGTVGSWKGKTVVRKDGKWVLK